MPSERLRLVQDGLARFNSRDFDAALRSFAPELEWDTTRMVPDGQVYRGREQIHAYWDDVVERWDQFRIEADCWLEGNERVVMLGRLVGKGSGSGVPVEAPWHQVWTFSGGVPIRCDNYRDREDALRAAGLDDG